MTVLSFRNIIVWPKRPEPRRGVKLHDQPIHGNPPPNSNIVVMPVVRIDRKTADGPVMSEGQYNRIEKIVARTMRGQRYSKRSNYAAEKLRKMWLNKA